MSGTRKSRAAGNSRGTAANPIPGNRPWQPGQSGNPSGRPKGISATVRDELAKVGGESFLVHKLLEQLQNPRVKPMEVVAIVKELSDRGYGKAPAFAAMEGGDPLELSDTQRIVGEILDELGARREAREAPQGSGASQVADG